MCSISGFIRFSPKGDCNRIQKKIRNIITKAVDRGRDSGGFATFSFSGKNKTIIKKTNGTDFINQIILDDNVQVLLNNNRAEPTTEFVENKKEYDVQPYFSKNCVAIHNGTIANDQELRKKYNIQTETNIDSATIPFLFDEISANDIETPVNILQKEIIGSYSTVVYNFVTKKIYIAVNYKPLYIQFDADDDVLYFSSLEKYIHNEEDYNEIFKKQNIKEVRPYSLLIIDVNTRDIKSFSLYQPKLRKKALIIASSGLDSTVAASWALNNNYDIELLHFNYNCRADIKEREHIKKIANFFNCQLTEISLGFFKDIIGGSNLFLEGDEIINNGNNGADGAELAIEWVPARNLVFLSIATAFAEARNIDFIILGGNLEESGAYADNEYIFQKKFNDILPNSLNLQTKIEILTPLANLMKKEIVEMGLKYNAPLDLTWSCYEKHEKHCGKCGPCFMRKTAFKMLGQKEVIEYENN